MTAEIPTIPPQTLEPTRPRFVEAYRAANEDVLSRIDLVETTEDWNERVENVIVVLCASRSGSSLIFNALASTGEVAAPAGEHEPWLSLTENKYPFIDSDAIGGELHNKNTLLRLIRNDLLVRDQQADAAELCRQLWNRFVVRRHEDDPRFLDVLLHMANVDKISQGYWGRVLEGLGNLALKQLPTKVEQFTDRSFGIPLENPPLIKPPFARLATDDDFQAKSLLFKSPSDVHRPGFYEELFPNASVTYIHLTRGFVQTTNGLMDGWQQDQADFISNPVGVISPLAIEDYSITDMTKAYWCFDLFDGWEDMAESPLLEVCAQQWLRAHRSAIEAFRPAQQLTFEQYYSDPEAFYKKLSDLTGVDTTGYDWTRSIMSTATPSQYRWLKRASTFKNLQRYLPGTVLREVVELQSHLGYNMQEETWL